MSLCGSLSGVEYVCKTIKKAVAKMPPLFCCFDFSLELLAGHWLGSFRTHFDRAWIHQRLFLKVRVCLWIRTFAATRANQSQKSHRKKTHRHILHS